MRTLIIIAVLTPSIAVGQPALTPAVAIGGPATTSPGYVAAGVELSADYYLNVAVVVEGGYRVGASPIALHALIGRGSFGGAPLGPSAHGGYAEYRVGAEADRCLAAGWLCAFLGVDVGYQAQHEDGVTKPEQAVVVSGRLGLEGHAFGARLAAVGELRGGEPQHGDGAGTAGVAGLATLGYRF
jgi:hypothetical protein